MTTTSGGGTAGGAANAQPTTIESVANATHLLRTTAGRSARRQAEALGALGHGPHKRAAAAWQNASRCVAGLACGLRGLQIDHPNRCDFAVTGYRRGLARSAENFSRVRIDSLHFDDAVFESPLPDQYPAVNAVALPEGSDTAGRLVRLRVCVANEEYKLVFRQRGYGKRQPLRALA